MHVANNPVQGDFGQGDQPDPLGTLMNGKIATSVDDVNLYYPNPMHGDDKFRDYAPYKWYEGGEFFKRFIKTSDIDLPGPSVALKAYYAWSRTSQWLPWMKMGDRQG